MTLTQTAGVLPQPQKEKTTFPWEGRLTGYICTPALKDVVFQGPVDLLSQPYIAKTFDLVNSSISLTRLGQLPLPNIGPAKGISPWGPQLWPTPTDHTRYPYEGPLKGLSIPYSGV